jgi:hypothetical protein
LPSKQYYDFKQIFHDYVQVQQHAAQDYCIYHGCSTHNNDCLRYTDADYGERFNVEHDLASIA